MRSAVNWFDIPVSDFQRAVRFYETILGITMHQEDFHGSLNALFPSDEQGVGGALCYAEGYAPSADGSIVYLNANGQIDAILRRVEAAGGKIARPKKAIPPQGYFAWIIDSEGNRVGLHQPE